MSPASYPVSLLTLLRLLPAHGPLLRQLIRRDVQARYRGSMLGVVWTLLTPLLMLAVYTFVFAFVFNARFGVPLGGQVQDGALDFPLMLFAGLMLHAFFAECMNRAPYCIVHNANYVKKIVFPLEIYPLMLIGTALTHLLISAAILVLGFAILYGEIQWTLLWLPVVLLPFLLLTLGLSWMLASLGVYVRDIGQVMGLLTTVLLFLSPVFYPVSRLPEALQQVIYLNPLTAIIEAFRDIALLGQTPDLMVLVCYSGVAVLLAWLGFAWFQKTRKGFADVL